MPGTSIAIVTQYLPKQRRVRTVGKHDWLIQYRWIRPSGRGARGQPPSHPQRGYVVNIIHLIKGFEIRSVKNFFFEKRELYARNKHQDRRTIPAEATAGANSR